MLNINADTNVKIGCYNYDIIFVDNNSEDLDYGQNWGVIDNVNLEIKIAQKLKVEQQEEIFLHEIIHGSLDYMDVEHDEELVSKLSKVLYQVLKDNKHFKV